MTTLPEYLNFKAQRMAALREKLAAPDAAPAPLCAVARVAGGSGVRPVSIREFTIVTDSAPALAGYNLGPTAPELLLASLASCLAHTYLIVAANRGTQFETLEVEVTGQIDFRGVLEVTPDAPIAPSGLAYVARVSGDVSDDELRQIRAEVERLCPVFRALVEPVPVSGCVERTAS